MSALSTRGDDPPEPPDRRFAPSGGEPPRQTPDTTDPGGGPPAWLRDLAVAAAQSPVPPLLQPPPDGGRPSAVLVLFGDGPDGPDLLLVQRGPGLRRHSGQPAFPGGAVDPGDGGPVPAALREAAEEAGVDPAGVEVLAVLPDLFIARSGFSVTPVLAWWRRPVPVAPADPPEVTAVARVPLSELADPARRLRIRHPSGLTGRPSGSAACWSGDSPRRWSTGCSRWVAGSSPGTTAGSRSCRRRHLPPGVEAQTGPR